ADFIGSILSRQQIFIRSVKFVGHVGGLAEGVIRHAAIEAAAEKPPNTLRYCSLRTSAGVAGRQGRNRTFRLSTRATRNVRELGGHDIARGEFGAAQRDVEQRPERDDFSSIRHHALAYWWSMIFSENRYRLFGIMLYAAFLRSAGGGGTEVSGLGWTVKVWRP